MSLYAGIVPCDSYPCLHGGTCENIDDGFRCICPMDWVGTQCETGKSDAEMDFTNMNDGFRCKCPMDWVGRGDPGELSHKES